MFQELYYEHYLENCRGAYWEERKSLPYAVLIREADQRAELEQKLLDLGFTCVVHENGYPCMYVNFTLKRFGRNVKACASASINQIPMTKEQFEQEILKPYCSDEQFRACLETGFGARELIHMMFARASLASFRCLWQTDQDAEKWGRLLHMCSCEESYQSVGGDLGYRKDPPIDHEHLRYLRELIEFLEAQGVQEVKD